MKAKFQKKYGRTPIFSLQFGNHGLASCQELVGISSALDGVFGNHFIQYSNMAGMPRCSHSFLQVVWFACVWVLWKERNNHVFQNTASDPLALTEKVKLNSFLWLKSKRPPFSLFSYHDWWQHPLLCMGVHM